MATQVPLTLPIGGGQSVTTGPRPAANPRGSPADDGAKAEQLAPHPRQHEASDARLVQQAIETINRKLQDSDQQLRFTVDHDSGRMVVRVIDTATNQTIRQIPSDVAIAISQSLEKLQGLLLRQRA